MKSPVFSIKHLLSRKGVVLGTRNNFVLQRQCQVTEVIACSRQPARSGRRYFSGFACAARSVAAVTTLNWMLMSVQTEVRADQLRNLVKLRVILQ